MTPHRTRISRAGIAAQTAQIERDLAAIRRAMRKPLEVEYAKANVTVPQKAVMQVVVFHPGTTLKDLSRAVSLAHSTVSGIVDRLEKRRLLERRTDPSDGRISRLYASAAVTQFINERIPAMRSGPLISGLARASAHDRAGILWALQRLRKLLEPE